MDKMNTFSVCFLLIVVAYASELKDTTTINVTETENSKKLETVAITVQHTDIERDEKGRFKDEESLKVSLKVSVQQGIVTVNNQKAKSDVVFAFHMHAEIDIIGKDAKVIAHRLDPIQIRVLVLEEKRQSGQLSVSRLLVQAQIVEVSGRQVEQIEIQEIVMELDNNRNEMLAKRSVIVLSLTKAEIHKRPRNRDHHVHCHRKGGHLPKSPYSMSKKDMGAPQKPRHPYNGDKTLVAKNGKPEKTFCSGFHNLPFGARLAIFITVAVVGLAILMCCVHVFCCKAVHKGQKYDLAQYDKDYFDTEMDDAPPLEKKKPLDEQKLVINA